MALTSSILSSLKHLPCFNEITEIILLDEGMSHTCVKVVTNSNAFFAKSLNQESASAEVIATLASSSPELLQKISPIVVYHDDNWLVTLYIDGISLANASLDNSEREEIALGLMAQLHQLDPKKSIRPIPILDTAYSASNLLTAPVSFLAQKRVLLSNITQSLTKEINTQILLSEPPMVLCHGDINYTNILIDKIKTPWLIDYECAHLAPAEFDLAMFIAVNNIPTNKISEMVYRYTCLVTNAKPNTKLLQYYMLYSFFINGLWYFDNMKDDTSDNEMLTLAVAQWQAFDNYAAEQLMDMPKLMAII